MFQGKVCFLQLKYERNFLLRLNIINNIFYLRTIDILTSCLEIRNQCSKKFSKIFYVRLTNPEICNVECNVCAINFNICMSVLSDVIIIHSQMLWNSMKPNNNDTLVHLFQVIWLLLTSVIGVTLPWAMSKSCLHRCI